MLMQTIKGHFQRYPRRYFVGTPSALIAANVVASVGQLAALKGVNRALETALK